MNQHAACVHALSLQATSGTQLWVSVPLTLLLPAACLLQRKPWGEMLDRSSLSKPSSMQEAYSRLRRNAGYFRVNYLIIAVLTVAGSFITHPSSLLVLAGLLALWVYMFAIKQGPLVLGDKEFRSVAVHRPRPWQQQPSHAQAYEAAAQLKHICSSNSSNRSTA